MDSVMGILIGIALAAACGFRVFVPLLVLAVASRAGMVSLGESLNWIGAWPAVIAFSVASIAEVVAYKVPWLDHALDTLASPAAVIAGTIVAASQIGAIGNVDPFLQWSGAIIAGGGAAGAVQATSVGTRAVSTIGTAGMLNPFISAAQSLLSVVASILAILAPIVAIIFLVIVLAVVIRLMFWLRKTRANRTPRATPSIA